MGEIPYGEHRPPTPSRPGYDGRAMNLDATSRAGAPAGATTPGGTDLLRRIRVIDDETVNLVAPSTPSRPLPCRADRQKIVEQASLVLSEAQVIAEQSDRCFTRLSAERPGEGTYAAIASFMGAGATGAFLREQS